MDPINSFFRSLHLHLPRGMVVRMVVLRGIGIVSLLLALSTPPSAKAQIFICKDDNGRTLTSDRPIPECANRPVRELNKSGVFKREILPPPSAEEQRQKKEAEEKRKAEEENASEQRRRNAALLQTYSNEQQIMLERQRTLSQLQNNLAIAITEKNAADQKRKAAQTEADELQKKGARVPGILKSRIDDATRIIQMEQKNADAYEAEIEKEKTKYDDILNRYRTVTGSSNAQGTLGSKK
jgi:hypothetical protein